MWCFTFQNDRESDRLTRKDRGTLTIYIFSRSIIDKGGLGIKLSLIKIPANNRSLGISFAVIVRFSMTLFLSPRGFWQTQAFVFVSSNFKGFNYSSSHLCSVCIKTSIPNRKEVFSSRSKDFYSPNQF